jgi:hypothetical protein
MITAYKSKVGKIVVIKDMDDEHLINAINFFKKQKEGLEDSIDSCYGCSFQGEMAQDYQDASINSMEKFSVEIEELLEALIQEKNNRNLNKKYA